MTKINEVLILVGGRGIRLDPLTRLYPKSLLMIGGKPFLELLIDSLKNRFDKYILCTWYKHKMFNDFIAYYKVKNPEIDIINSVEHSKIGTAGALRNAEQYITGEYFMVINGDTLFGTENLDYILKETDPDFIINEVVDKDMVPTGVRIIDSIALGLIPFGYYSLEDDLCKLYPRNIIQIDDTFVDIGTMENYRKQI